MKVSIREEIAKIAWPAIGNDHLIDLYVFAIVVDDGGEIFLEGWVEDVPFPYLL